MALEDLGDSGGSLRFASIHSVRSRPDAVEDAVNGDFWLGDDKLALSAPIDWWDEPYRVGERAFFLNSFVFADPVLSAAEFEPALVPLGDIFVNWIRANPREGSQHPHRYAWHDHAAAGRLVYIAFVLREGVRLGSLEEETATQLACTALEHADYLLADENYSASHNHGLFSDAALALAARSLAPAQEASEWDRRATVRFEAVLERTVSSVDALHLEHSPYYHWIIREALRRFAQAGLFEELDLSELVARMGESAAWLVAPDGTLPPIGDTPFGRPPSREAVERSRELVGLKLFADAGYTAIRDGGSCLIITAAHHPTGHKHADDGSFCLYEDGQPLVIDSGDPGYEYDGPDRRYGTAPRAHAAASVDGFDWRGERSPHGSGIVAAVEDDGIYAVLTRTPGGSPGGGDLRRVLAYAPGESLVIVDLVEAGQGERVERHLPLAADLHPTLRGDGRIVIDRAARPAAWIAQLNIQGTRADTVSFELGQEEPELAGFQFSSPGAREPRPVVAFLGLGDHPRGTAIAIGPEPPADELELVVEAGGEGVGISIIGVMPQPLRIDVGRGTLALVGSSGK